MCSLAQRLQDIEGSGYRVGAADVSTEVAREVTSVEEGSVVVRGMPEVGDRTIGAGVFGERNCLV